MILLGMGMNGHLGLNEPGASWDLNSHIIRLDETTRKVGQKYFSRETELTSGITVGMKQILTARTIILQVNGSRKAGVVNSLMNRSVSLDFPASALKQHSNAYLLLDMEAAKYHKIS
jgi:6-phosphogluconolactonase/glucosamine-6-phosphate isomerase/deaminase